MIRKNIKNQIEEYFFLNPTTKLRLRQIEREVKVPFPSVVRYAKELTEENLLKKETISNITIYSANRNSKEYLLEKKLFNIKQLQELTNYIIEELSNPNIIIFGSYSKGEDIESSDIDLFIETPSKKELDLKKFEKELQRKIQLFTHKKITDIKNKDLINNIINGISLNGFVEIL